MHDRLGDHRREIIAVQGRERVVVVCLALVGRERPTTHEQKIGDRGQQELIAGQTCAQEIGGQTGEEALPLVAPFVG